MKEKTLLWLRRIHPLIKLLVYIAICGIIYLMIKLPIDMLFSYTGICIYEKSLRGAMFFTIQYSVMPAAIILGTYSTLKLLHNDNLCAIGYVVSKKSISEVGYGILIGFALPLIIFIIELSFGWIEIKGFAWHYLKLKPYLIYLYKSIIMYIAVSFTEETFARGYLMKGIMDYKGKVCAVLVSSIIFASMHIPNAVGTWAVWVVPFSLTLAGILMALLYYWKNSIWIPLGFHFAWNFFQYEFFSLPGYGESRSVFFRTELTGPSFWVGLKKSSFGPEVGALGVIVLTTCIVIMIRKFTKE